MKSVVVTGGAGLIGSAMVWRLNQEGINDVLVVDDLGTSEKWKNLVGLRYTDYLHKDEFLKQVKSGTLPVKPDAVVHMGACSATTERDADYLMENNYRYTRYLAEWSLGVRARFVYASSGATYGGGERGFSDDPAELETLKPLNMYGYSKQIFDLHAKEAGLLSSIVGIKFFNVFGPNEYHKGSMTSVVYNAYNEITRTGRLRLFRSEKPEYADGEQKRDFVYVKDCVNALWWLLQNPQANGLFNLGTGQARTWNDLGHAVFAALKLPVNVEYVDLPDALRGKYQYFTQAQIGRLRAAGYTNPFHSLENAVHDYVTNYLAQGPAHLTTVPEPSATGPVRAA